MIRAATILLLVTSLTAAGCRRGAPPGETSALVIFAAASTTDVITTLANDFAEQHDVAVRTNFASSAVLARQIAAGAAADVYLSASTKWMDDVERRGVIQPRSRVDLLRNRLVLIAPRGTRFDVQFEPGFPIEAKFAGLLALGDPAHVPAGRYARQALRQLGWWERLESRLLPAMDVRGALRLVELQEAGAGFVYATDAAASERVTPIAPVPESLHAPIVYPIALCRGNHPAAARLLAFLRSAAAMEVYRSAGFESASGADG